HSPSRPPRRPPTMSPTVFLSCVNDEFGSLRPKLARMVRRTNLGVRHQDDFAHRGVRTLQKLQEEVSASDVVFHILGKGRGAPTPPAQVEALLERHPDFEKRFPEIAAAGRGGSVTYTQWEAWFALHFGKRLCSFKVTAPAPESVAESGPEQVSQQ